MSLTRQENPRYRTCGKPIAFVGLIFLLGALLVPGIRPLEGRWHEAWWNLLHVPAFFGLCCALDALVPTTGNLLARRIFVLITALVLAVGTEWAQASLGRSGSWKDLIYDGLGIVLAVVWWRFGRGRGGLARIGVGLVAVGIGWACLWPAWGTDWAESQQRNHLPEIGNFSRWETRHLWQAQGSSRVEVDGRGLRVRIWDGRYGGVSFWPGEQDWSNYSVLVLEIENPGNRFELGIRIDDPTSAKRREWISSSTLIERGNQKTR